MTLDPVLAIAGGVVVVGGAGALIAGFMRWLARTGKNVADIKDDLLGEPARDGVPERPGVMKRLAGVDVRLDGIESAQAAMAAELQPNGGGSMRDAVNRLETGQEATNARLTALESRLTALESAKPVTVNVHGQAAPSP